MKRVHDLLSILVEGEVGWVLLVLGCSDLEEGKLAPSKTVTRHSKQ
jgi:hypothetical protein